MEYFKDLRILLSYKDWVFKLLVYLWIIRIKIIYVNGCGKFLDYKIKYNIFNPLTLVFILLNILYHSLSEIWDSRGTIIDCFKWQ